MRRPSYTPGLLLLAVSVLTPRQASPQDWRALEERRPRSELPHTDIIARETPGTSARVLIAGDSWAQYMWDDGSHNDVFDRFGHADKQALSQSLATNPGPGYTGPEYSISGAEARQWINTANFPWIANMVAELEANPDIETVVLSIGGNDILAGRSGGGWYKDMDLDAPGSEAALFAQLEANTFQIAQAALDVRPGIQVMLTSYDYPNFNVGFWCFVFACPKRRELSRDPDNDLITDEEINQMIVTIETIRIGWADAWDRVIFDNAVGLMHHAYGDGVSEPGILPKPGLVPPDYLPFPGGNPLLPSLRMNFRRPSGIDADPIHLDYEAYQYKITHETEGFFWPTFRGSPNATFTSQGTDRDGWTDGTLTGTEGVRLGDTGTGTVSGILSFDTSAIPDGTVLSEGHLYLFRDSLTGSNPLTSGALGPPILDVAQGTFGAPEIEPSDLLAPADVSDAGWFHGSAREDYYAVRIELTPAAVLAINDQGITQFRISIPAADAGADYLTFRDGDALPLDVDGPPTLAEILGASTPFLDVMYDTPTAVAAAEPRKFRLAQNAPNPFRGSTSLQLQIPRAAFVRLNVYDVAGRLVARLLDEERSAGGHTVTWNGRDRSRRPVSAGVYWARLDVGGASDVVRMVRLEAR